MDFLAKTFISFSLCALLILPTVVDSILPEEAQPISKQSFGKTDSCSCVVFRLDDVQDDYLDSVQKKIMDIFLSKGANLTIGLIMHSFGNDTDILNKISEGNKKGLFELAMHGWEHKNYSDLSQQEQKSSLYKANEKMQMIFGNRTDIFIPPYNKFNNATIAAFKELGIKIMSSSILDQYRYDLGKSVFISNEKKQNSSASQIIYFLPFTTSFKYFVGDSQIRVPVEEIVSSINANIEKFGYAVVLIHPQNFIKLDERGHFLSNEPKNAQIDNHDVKDLENLIDLLIQKGIAIDSFHKVIGT